MTRYSEQAKQRLIVLAGLVAVITSVANICAWLRVPTVSALSRQADISMVAADLPRAQPTPELNPCKPGGGFDEDSGICLKFRVDQLNHQYNLLRQQLVQVQQQPSVPADLNQRITNLQKSVDQARKGVDEINRYLRRGKADSDFDNIWAQIDIIKQKIGLK